MSEEILKRQYYSMGEVCDLTGLKPHVLRYWESQFEVLRPGKNRAGNRVFVASDIEQVLLVRHLLYERQYTIEAARKKLEEIASTGRLQEERHGVAGSELLAAVRAELEALRQVLTVPARGR